MKHGENVKPYQIFLSGPGGVGKSHVVKLVQSRAYNTPLVQSDTIKLLKLSGTFEPDVIVLLTAPTGRVAAFNINGIQGVCLYTQLCYLAIKDTCTLVFNP